MLDFEPRRPRPRGSDAAKPAGGESRPKPTGGQPLDRATRLRMELAFGQPFGDVRLHTGAAAGEVAAAHGANAVTAGEDVRFAAGRYEPGRADSAGLLAHELAHVVQQRSAGAPGSEVALESEARSVAGQVVEGRGPPAGSRALSSSGGRRVQRNGAGTSPTTTTTTGTAKPTVLAGVASDEPIPALSLDELEARIRLIDAQLTRLGAAWVGDTVATDSIRDSHNAVTTKRAAITGGAVDAGAVIQAQTIVERVERAIGLLNTERTSIKGSDYTDEIDRVRKLYLTVLTHIFQPDVVTLFNQAETAAVGLPRALINVELRQFEHHGQLNQEVLTYSKELVDWVDWTRQLLDAQQIAATELARARTAHAPDLAAREARFQEVTERLELTIEGLGQFDIALRAHELALKASRNPFDWPLTGASGRILQRLEKIKDADVAGNMADLRSRLSSFRSDQTVIDFYKALPAAIAISGMVARLAIVLVASIATAGVGGAIGTGATTGATVTGGVTVGSALAFAGTAALEALTFTGVSQGLSAVVLGDPLTVKGFLVDLAWNIGLFGAMRGLSLGVGRGLSGTGLEMLRAPVALTVSFPILMGYGVIRFRLSQGHWPSDEELDQMTAETLLTMLAVTVTTSAVQRWLPSGGRKGALETFRTKYGLELGSIEAGRQGLAQQLGALMDAGVAQTDPRVTDLQAKARTLEDMCRDVLNRATADPAIDLARIRAELKAARTAGVRVASELLSLELGVPVDAALRPAGERAYTYAWGKTGDVEGRLRAAKAMVIKPAPDPATGARTLIAQFGAEPPLTFEERTDPGYGYREVFVDPDNPAIQRLFTDQAINDPGARRTVLRMIATQMSRNPAMTVEAATRVAGRELQTRLRAAPAGTTMEALLSGLRTQGIVVATAPAAMVAQAQALVRAGILRSAGWLDARTQDQFAGTIGEWLARQVVEGAARPGETVYRNVRFGGDLFTDPAGTVAHTMGSGRPAVNVDVAELDFMVGSATGPKVEVQTIANAKAVTGLAGDAAAQNQNAINALRAHGTGGLARITSGGRVLYARINTVAGVDVTTNADVDLTGRLAEKTGGAKTETIGPLGARGYTAAMPLNAAQIQSLVALLRDMQAVAGGGY